MFVFIVFSGFGCGRVMFFWEVFVCELLLLWLDFDFGDVWMFERLIVFEKLVMVCCVVFCLNVCDGSGVGVLEKFGRLMVWRVILFVVNIVW